MPRDRGTPAMTRQWSFDLTQQQEQGRGGGDTVNTGDVIWEGEWSFQSHLLEPRALWTDSRSHPHKGLSAHMAGKPVKTGAA